MRRAGEVTTRATQKPITNTSTHTKAEPAPSPHQPTIDEGQDTLWTTHTTQQRRVGPMSMEDTYRPPQIHTPDKLHLSKHVPPNSAQLLATISQIHEPNGSKMDPAKAGRGQRGSCTQRQRIEPNDSERGDDAMWRGGGERGGDEANRGAWCERGEHPPFPCSISRLQVN